MLKTAASFVLGRDSRCGVAQGYASLASLPAASLDNRFEHPTRDEKSKRFALRKAIRGREFHEIHVAGSS
jgi:hypothetical protein